LAQEGHEEGDKVPHRNREVTLTYQGDEEHPINI
jgi:sodium/potassium-transporting ATPase subunit alpha